MNIATNTFRSALIFTVLGTCTTASTAQQAANDVDAVAQSIDRGIDKALQSQGIKPSPQTSDAEFLRRVTLDLIGRIPTADEASAFLKSSDPDRRRKLIDALLAKSNYGEYFAGIWTDLIQATGEPPNSMGPKFHDWLADAFNKGRGWDKVAYDMLATEGASPAGYLVWANYKEPGQLAGTTAQFFLGMQIQCAQCHNHPFTKWKRTDYWSFAAFYTRLRREKVKGKGTGLTENADPKRKKKNETKGAAIVIPGASKRVVQARFLGDVEPKLPDAGPLRPTLASWITSRDNPYFAKAAVNRMWGHLFGRGFVNPVDDFRDDVQPSHPALLQLLTRKFVESGYDLKHLIRCICNSDMYQRSSTATAENKDDETLFSRRPVKVMRPGALFDSLVTAMGNPKLRGGLGSPLPYEIYSGKSSRNNVTTRTDFIKFFGGNPGDGTKYSYGISQALAMMNAQQFNDATPVVDRLVKSKAGKEKAIDTLYLATLSRYPTERERQIMNGYIDRRANLQQGYAGVLWILCNTSEFVLNQ